MLEITSTAIPDVKVLLPKAFGDARGTFSETYNAARFAEHGINAEFRAGQPVVVGAGGHHPRPCTSSRRRRLRTSWFASSAAAFWMSRLICAASSPTYGKWVAEELSAQNRKQLLVPIGFAHGFCTLEPDTEVLYKVTDFYSPANDLGIAWDDPDLAIAWPVTKDKAVLSEKDARQPAFKSLPAYF